MLRERVRRGLVAGIIAAAATAGVLLGLGRSHGATFTLLNDTAHILIGERARLVESPHAVVTPLAMLVHVMSLLVWGVLFAMIAASWRGWRLIAAAVLFTAGALLADLFLLPASLRPGFETAMSVPELILLYAVFALALGFGLGESRRVAGVA